ncbi:putative quinol monooxygenase [Niabella soli]|uniref:Antibiotic biosynthesis monooxygenase n=1 Tax=Niabella soli DSM 19437 TaxID=929713 RepID=W0F4H9_9BACT|nr:antibiotic biosynthesis monooxygenase [Niabella soli]AHF16226.1 antibiotic biosynthesis monooxygenase [Niabella soli DSM 19437]
MKQIRKNAVFFLIALLMLFMNTTATAQQQNRMIRIAKIEIDSAYLDQYKADVAEHTKAAVQLEPGVLGLYAMYEKEHPNRVTILEIYANKEAYQAHLKTPHFLKYKTSTLKMVQSLQLIDMDPIAFAAKTAVPDSAK